MLTTLKPLLLLHPPHSLKIVIHHHFSSLQDLEALLARARLCLITLSRRKIASPSFGNSWRCRGGTGGDFEKSLKTSFTLTFHTHVCALCRSTDTCGAFVRMRRIHRALNCHLPPVHTPISNSLCACLSHTAFNCETVAGPALLIDFLLLKAQPKGS